MTQIWFPGRQIVIQDWKTGKTTRGAALFNPPAGRVDETDFPIKLRLGSARCRIGWNVHIQSGDEG